MESLFCTFSPAPPRKFRSLKLCTMTVSQTSPLSVKVKRRKSVARSKKPSSQTASATVTSTPSTITADSSSPCSVPPKKVLVPIGLGTEEMEAVVLIDVLRRAGAKVTVASVEPQLEIVASSGTKLVADSSVSTCSDEVFDLVALPGGMPGSARLRDCQILCEITTRQAQEERLYGAICAAPAVTLLPWGLHKRKQITCHPAFMDKLPTFRAVKSNLQVSGNLTTSPGPGTSFLFALSFVEQLFGESVAREVGRTLLMHTDDDECRTEEFNATEWYIGPKPRVLVPIANGSEGIEIVTIIDVLRRAKVEVVVASMEKSMQILASQSTKIVADELIGDAAKLVYDLIILPGGISGAECLQKSKVLKKLLLEQDEGGRMYGAVCSSISVLHKHNLLKDKRVANVVDRTKAMIDGKLITSKGLSTVTDFALAIVSKLFSHSRARSVAEGLVFDYPRTE